MEADDAELALTAQTETSLSPQLIVEAQPNNGGNRKADAGGNENGKNSKPERLKDGTRYDTYTDLTDMIENIYLATQTTMPYRKPPVSCQRKSRGRVGSSADSMRVIDMIRVSVII